MVTCTICCRATGAKVAGSLLAHHTVVFIRVPNHVTDIVRRPQNSFWIRGRSDLIMHIECAELRAQGAAFGELDLSRLRRSVLIVYLFAAGLRTQGAALGKLGLPWVR